MKKILFLLMLCLFINNASAQEENAVYDFTKWEYLYLGSDGGFLKCEYDRMDATKGYKFKLLGGSVEDGPIVFLWDCSAQEVYKFLLRMEAFCKEFKNEHQVKVKYDDYTFERVNLRPLVLGILVSLTNEKEYNSHLFCESEIRQMKKSLIKFCKKKSIELIME